ncbi:MAG: hypothetical protein ACKO2V_24565, partial [Snowella sp.]
MIAARWRRYSITLALCFLLLVSACAAQPPSRYGEIQKETTQRGAPQSVVKESQKGGEFNQFFPKKVPGYTIVPAQEKKGFAEYKVNQDGKNVAMLSISDTINLPAAAAKYQNTQSNIAGYPAVEQGTMATGILINGRYQVKVLSRDTAFTKEDRAA